MRWLRYDRIQHCDPDLQGIEYRLITHNFKSLRPENSIKYGADVMPNSCTYRCHQDKGADKTARANWAISAMSPVAATTTASATTTKAPAFELIFAVGALFIATLVRRR